MMDYTLVWVLFITEPKLKLCFAYARHKMSKKSVIMSIPLEKEKSEDLCHPQA